MEATADGEFKQYSIKLKDIYQWNIENQPEKFYMHTPRECGEISFLPVDPTPEGYMGNDDYFRIAGIYLWSKEPKEINRLELHGEEFHGTENGVAVDSYRGGVPSDTILRVKDVTATSSEYQPIFGGKAKIESMMNVGLYNPETGGKVSASRKFWISLKVPENVSPFDLTVYRVYIDGTAEEVTSVIEDDSLAIYTYDAGIYALVNVDYALTEDVEAYFAAYMEACDAYGYNWCLWEFGNSFGAYNLRTNQWKSAVIDNLIFK